MPNCKLLLILVLNITDQKKIIIKHLAAKATSVLQHTKYPKFHHSLEHNCENYEIQGCLFRPLMDVIFIEHILTDLSMVL